MSQILLDTNVLIYVIDKNSAFYSAARKLFESGHELFTTSKNISEFLAVITRAPIISLSVEEALTVIEDFATLLTILYPNQQSMAMFQRLLRQYRFTGLKIHDLEIACIGLTYHIDQIATCNAKDFEEIQEVSLLTL